MIDISKKQIFIIVIILIVVIALAYYFFSRSEDIKLSIDVLETTDNIGENGSYIPRNTFTTGQEIFVFEDFSNFIVTDNDTKCNLFLELSIIYKPDDMIVKSFQYNLTDYKLPYADAVVEYVPWNFNTDISWETGNYRIDAFIKDNLSDQTATASTGFTLI